MLKEELLFKQQELLLKERELFLREEALQKKEAQFLARINATQLSEADKQLDPAVLAELNRIGQI